MGGTDPAGDRLGALEASFKPAAPIIMVDPAGARLGALEQVMPTTGAGLMTDPFGARLALLERAGSLLGPIAWTSGIPNEYGTPGSAGSLGAANKQVGSTTHFCFYEDLADGSFEVDFWNGSAHAGNGEWSAGASASGKCSVLWIDQNKVQHITQLVAADLLSTTAVAADGQLLRFFGPSIRGLVGSHALVKFWGSFGNGGYYSHAKADYANGEELVYGATVTDHTGDFGSYGNTSTAFGDHYGPVFIGGNVKRATFIPDSDSRDAGVLTTLVCDVPNKLSGGHGTINRLLIPWMAGMDISVPGSTAQEMADPTKTPMRDWLINNRSGPKATRIAALGVNDTIASGRSAALVIADEATRQARLRLKSIPATVSPVVTDATHNTVYSPSNDPNRIALNAARRAVAGVIDPASVLESSGTPGTVNTLADMADGFHQNATGNEDVRSGLAGYDVAGNFGAPGTVNFGFQYASGASYQSLALADSWSASDGVWTPNNVYSPEHKLTAGTLVEAATTANHQVFKQPTLGLGAGAHTLTAFAKRGAGARNLRLETYKSDFSVNGIVSFDLGAGAVLFTTGTNALFTALSGAVTTFDDFFKLVVSFTLSGTLTNPYVILDMADGSGVNGYAGDGASSVIVWGVDLR